MNITPQQIRQLPESCTLVIFGATGDLTHRKLIPALYNLAVEGALPAGLKVVGFARREKSHEEFRDELKITTQKFSRTSLNEEIWNRFAQSISYHRSEFHDLNGYCRLVEQLGKEDVLSKSTGNRLFYLAVAPDQVETILHNLKESGLNFPRDSSTFAIRDGDISQYTRPQNDFSNHLCMKHTQHDLKNDFETKSLQNLIHSNSESRAGSWARVIIEKPFGVDLKTAHHLNKLVHGAFPEKETYRIDHYLGKETAQNIMVLRFANSIFESIWNSKHVHHVQITAAEPLGVEGRAGYYDKAGALRDMVQNHLLQLLTLMAMEPPMSMSADSIRDEKVKVLKSLRPLRGENVFKNVVRGQYAEGIIKGNSVPAYRSELGVAPESTTESYVALQIAIDNWRWAGVPFFVRAGKRMAHTGTEIAITFNAVPPVLFNTLGHTLEQNVLVIRIQPNEGISLGMSAKTPGSTLQIEPVKMNFCYGTSFQKQNPEAYERLLLDAMSGDATLFARSDEVEAAWAFVDGIEEAWLQSSDDLKFYPSGGCGPEAADDLLAASGAAWRML